MVLPTVHPPSRKRKKVNQSQPLVTLRASPRLKHKSPKPKQLVSLRSTPASSQRRESESSPELGNIIVERTSTSRKEVVGIKMPVARHLRVRGSSERQSISGKSSSSPQPGGSRGEKTNSCDSDIEIVAVTTTSLRSTRRLAQPSTQQSVKVKIPARPKSPRVHRATQTEQLAARSGPSAEIPVANAGEQSLSIEDARRVLDLDETEFSYLEMKLLEERMTSWNHYSTAEDEMSTIVQNYLALEKELAETKEELRLVKGNTWQRK